MAKNDYFVIVYKILQHLYECLKNERDVNWDELKPNSKKFPVGEEYWNYVWVNLSQEGLVTGVDVFSRMNVKPGAKITRFLEITPKGIAYLEENSMMSKVKNGIQSAAELISNIF